MIQGQRILPVILLLLSAPGCTLVLDTTIDKAPNRYLLYRHYLDLVEPSVDPSQVPLQFQVAVGPPYTTLWVGIVDPPYAACQTPRGTVFVLHGVFSASSRSPDASMFAMAHRMALEGYRAVLVDLRGHGRSGGEVLTWGVIESCDVRQVLSALEQQGLIVGPIGVVGHSLGAGVALLMAAHDPRISAVVAVAPPMGVREALPNFARNAAPITEYLFSYEDYQRAINRAAAQNGVHPQQTDTVLAIHQTRIPVLIVQATDDGVSPVSNGARLQNAAGGYVELWMLPGVSPTANREGHSRLLRDNSNQVKTLAADWFHRWLDGA